MLNNALGRFRIIAFIEGISYIVLLVFSILKRMGGMPEYVKFFGWAHGLFFVLYLLALVMVATEHGWKFTKIALAFLISLIPFGNFWFDSRLKKEQESNPA